MSNEDSVSHKVIHHDHMSIDEIFENLPLIVYRRLKGRVLNSLEVYLDPSDKRFPFLKTEVCSHISDISNYIAQQLNSLAQQLEDESEGVIQEENESAPKLE